MLYNSTTKQIVQSKKKKITIEVVVKFFTQKGKNIPTVTISSDGFIEIDEENYNKLSDTEKIELKDYLNKKFN